jgi:hypothetical protein
MDSITSKQEHTDKSIRLIAELLVDQAEEQLAGAQLSERFTEPNGGHNDGGQDLAKRKQLPEREAR